MRNRRVLLACAPAWCFPVLVGLAIAFLQVAGLEPLLRFEASRIPAEPWRLLTGNFVHLGWAHLALNLAGLALAWMLFGKGMRVQAWSSVFLVCSFSVGGGLFLFSPEISWYVGFSGVLHGVVLAGAVAADTVERKARALLLAGLAAKVGWEQFQGGAGFTADLIGGRVIVDAHLYGALAGAVSAGLVRFHRVAGGGAAPVSLSGAEARRLPESGLHPEPGEPEGRDAGRGRGGSEPSLPASPGPGTA